MYTIDLVIRVALFNSEIQFLTREASKFAITVISFTNTGQSSPGAAPQIVNNSRKPDKFIT